MVGVTAATGIASINIGGCTLHSWAGIGLGKGDPLKIVARLIGHDNYLKKRAAEDKNNLPVDDDTFTTDRWKRTKVLIIDESTEPRALTTTTTYLLMRTDQSR